MNTYLIILIKYECRLISRITTKFLRYSVYRIIQTLISKLKVLYKVLTDFRERLIKMSIVFFYFLNSVTGAIIVKLLGYTLATIYYCSVITASTVLVSYLIVDGTHTICNIYSLIVPLFHLINFI